MTTKQNLKFGNYVKELRLNKGMTQTELAKALGVTLTTVWNIENGKYTARLSTFRKMSEVFDVEIQELRNHAK